MRHLSEGLLRRLHDDRFAASNEQRDHLAHCERCQRRMGSVARDAVHASGLLAPNHRLGVGVEPALARLRQSVAADAPSSDAYATPRPARRHRWVFGSVAAPVVAVAFVASANAAGWLSIFSPTQVAPITLTVGDLKGLPDLSSYGRMQFTNIEPRQVAGAAQAAAATGLTVLRPSSLPANVPTQVRWEVVGRGQAVFTLDSGRAAAAAARAGHAAPSIPSGLDGTSVTVTAGPAVFAVYGATGVRSESTPPSLVIAEGVRPTASTNGASLTQLEDFLLAQPGVSPQLAADIRAIGSPTSTLPIPIISGLMTSETVSIDGVKGVAAGDSTGLGAAVIWEKDGVVYAVGGLLSQSEVLDIARSLH